MRLNQTFLSQRLFIKTCTLATVFVLLSACSNSDQPAERPQKNKIDQKIEDQFTIWKTTQDPKLLAEYYQWGLGSKHNLIVW